MGYVYVLLIDFCMLGALYGRGEGGSLFTLNINVMERITKKKSAYEIKLKKCQAYLASLALIRSVEYGECPAVEIGQPLVNCAFLVHKN